MWRCPKCHRAFTRKNQRHACGVGSRDEVLRDRPAALVALYTSLEKSVRALGSVEVVARERYVLFRSKRVFADLVVMADCLRVALHLGRKVPRPLFFKIAADRKAVTHVAKLRTEEELAVIQPLLREAYDFSLSIPSKA
jgi:predicted transport protein